MSSLDKLSTKYERRNEGIFQTCKIMKYLLPLEPFSGSYHQMRRKTDMDPGNRGSNTRGRHINSMMIRKGMSRMTVLIRELEIGLSPVGL